MNSVALRAVDLGKLYQIGRRSSHNTLRDLISEQAKRPLTWLRGASHAEQKEKDTGNALWALRHVSFEVTQGEVLGVIGRNGAGKSTLLKILSRITNPTAGCVEGYGRVGSLLEVGTGFHPELSGRENIFLNGAILGMKRVEIQRKMDEIIAFSEIERFLDTPVKRYSSGMYVRLAFAVAAHLEPEILIVDEVLAGDAAFQKKCLGKMGDVAKEGRTILFVSHNLGAVQALCSRVIYLRQGSIATDDSAAASITAYLKSLEEQVTPDLLARSERRGQGHIRLVQMEIFADGEPRLETLIPGRSAQFVFYVTALHSGMSCSFTIYDQSGQPVTYFDSAMHSRVDTVDSGHHARFICEIETLTLIPGHYRINAAIMWNGEIQDHLEGAASFDVTQGEIMGRPVAADSGFGSVLLQHRWVTPL